MLQNQVHITGRKLLIQLNNGWKDLSDHDFAVTLEPPDSNGVCCGTSSPEFLKYMAHRLVALNFKIEYSAILPTKPPRPVNHTIAWATFLPSLN